MAELKFNLEPVAIGRLSAAVYKRAQEFTGKDKAHRARGASIDLVFGDTPHKGSRKYVCTGHVYTYNFSEVFSGPACEYRGGRAVLPYANDHAYEVYASLGHDGVVFGVDNAERRRGTAELELLACLAAVRNSAAAYKVHTGKYCDQVLALQHIIQPDYGVGMPNGQAGYWVTEKDRDALTSRDAFALYHVSRLLGHEQPVSAWGYGMPYAGAVCAETLVRMYSRDALLEGLRTAHRFFAAPLSDNSIKQVISDVAQVLCGSKEPWDSKFIRGHTIQRSTKYISHLEVQQ